MDPVISTAHDSIVQSIGDMADFFGFSAIMGHLYGALLLNPEPMSMDELEASIGKSKASVSTNIRALERWGMVREVWVKADRKKYYAAETDFWKIATSILQSREKREFEITLENLNQVIDQMQVAKSNFTSQESAVAEYYLKRASELKELAGFALLAIDIVLSRSRMPEKSGADDLLGLLIRR